MVSSQTLGPCCVSGHLHEGTPRGEFKDLHGVKTYVTGDEANKAKTIVYVTDIFGVALVNAQLLADEIAAAGFHVVMPDLLDGDNIKPELLLKIAPRTSLPERSEDQAEKDGKDVGDTLGPWIERHPQEKVQPKLEGFVKALRADSAVSKIGAIGFCWGGKYALLLTHGHVDAAVLNHPSFLAIPDDLKDVKAPVSIAVGDKDGMFSDEDQKTTQAYFDKELSSLDTQLVVYPNEVHGFAVRGDINAPREKEAKEKSTQQAVDWFKKHL